MKLKHYILLGICLILLLGGVDGIYFRHMFNNQMKDITRQLKDNHNEVYSEEGFYDIRYETEDLEYVLIEGHVITEDEFDALDGIEECWDEHLDIFFEDAISYFSLHMHEWPPYDWKRRESVEYIDYEYERDIHCYTKEIYWYSEEHGDGGIVPKIQINADAVTGRIHSISFLIPNENNSKEAFIQTMHWMGYKGDSEKIFDKMLNKIHKLGDNERIDYKQDNFDFGMKEFDYTNLDTIGPDKMYAISIRLRD